MNRVITKIGKWKIDYWSQIVKVNGIVGSWDKETDNNGQSREN